MRLERIGSEIVVARTLAVFLLGAVLSCVAAYVARQDERREADDRFRYEVQRLEGALRGRLQTHENVLQGAAGLIAASDEVRREEWRTYAAGLGLRENFPGIAALGYAQWLRPADVPLHTEKMRAEGFVGYTVFPSGRRANYAPVTYVEPYDAINARAIGFDMYADTQRQAAMDRARDTGQPTLSGRIVLATAVGENPPPAVSMYLPVYRRDLPVRTLAERRAALAGFVSAPMRVPELFAGLAGGDARGVAVRVYDDGQRLFAEDAAAPSGVLGPAPLERQLEIYGRVWRLEFFPTTEFAGSDLPMAPAVLVAGLLISMLLAALLRAQASAEVRALAMAQDMTRALRDAEAGHRAVVESSAEGILTIDPTGIVQSFNRAAEHMFGFAAPDVVGRNVSMLMPERYRARHDSLVANFDRTKSRDILGLRREVIGLRRDGHEFPMSLAINVIDSTGPRRLVGVISDLSERKRIEGELAEAHSLRQSIFDGAAFGIVATDVGGIVRAMNPAAERLLWYRREDLVGKCSLTVLHDPEELAQRACELSQELEVPITADFAALSAKAGRGLTDESEWTYVRKDGSHVPVQVAVTALRDAGGSISGYLGIAYDVTERKRQEEYIRHIALHDALTQLPNRALLQDRISVAIAQAHHDRAMVGVLMVDLDHFKRINDSLGHHVGDQVLLKVAERLKTCVRSGDSVARMGGDEFVVLIAGSRDVDGIRRVAEGIVAAFKAALHIGPHEFLVSASIGIACYPHDGGDVATLLKNADTAMYHAKAAGRARYQMFSEEMLRKANEKLELENALRRALARGEFAMHYEPQVSLQTGEVLGAEALIRWAHPERGSVSPGDFIPVAEETGLIVPIGEWTLRTACSEGRQIQTRLGQALSIAVNLSPRQFAQPNLIDLVQDACREAMFDPRHLILEITEGTLMNRSEQTIEVLQRLRQLGVRVAVDDFGTGYSSLSYITRFPIDLLKIDRSFVRDINHDPADAAVASAIIAMAHGLGISVVAEGVETVEQLRMLRERACDAAQGYFIGLGAPAATFTVQGYLFTQALPAEQLPAKVVALRSLRDRV